MFHNLKGYVEHLLFQDLFSKRSKDIQVGIQGTKILKLDVGNVRFIDSFCFSHQALECLSKSFSFKKKNLLCFNYISMPQRNQYNGFYEKIDLRS